MSRSAVSLAGTPVNWKDQVPEDIHEMFTCGDCWVLAVVLHEKLGYPLYNFEQCHLFVKMPDEELYVDINGIQTLEELREAWFDYGEARPEGDSFTYNKEEDTSTWGATYYEGSWIAAEQWANDIINLFGLEPEDG